VYTYRRRSTRDFKKKTKELTAFCYDLQSTCVGRLVVKMQGEYSSWKKDNDGDIG
jgi:hypothetical protein